MEGTRSKSDSKKSGPGSTNSDRAVYSAVCRAQSNDGQTYVGDREVEWTAGEGTTRHRLYRDDCE